MKSAVALLLLVLTGVAPAASPRDELLRLVPPDAGFVVVVQDLRANAARWQASPWLAKLKQTKLGRAVAHDMAATALAEIDRELIKEVGQPWAKLRDDVVGDAVVFVYRPGPPENPEAEEALVLIHARDPAAAGSLFAHLDKQQTKAGKLKSTTELKHGDRAYRKRVRVDEPAEFQYQNGSFVAFGTGETLLKKVIDAQRQPAQGPPALVGHFQRLGVDAAAAVWWINPRSFDAAMAAKSKKAAGPEAAVLNAVATHWKALEGAALFFDARDDTRLGLALSVQSDKLPPATRVFFGEWAKPSMLLAAFPEDALLTLTGRVALPPLMEMGSQIMTEQARSEMRANVRRTFGAALGSDVLGALPERLGPDWGVCVTAPKPGEEHYPCVTAAVRLSQQPGDPPVVQRVLDGLNALGIGAALAFNARQPDPVMPHSQRLGDVDVRYFAGGGLPKGLRPAFAWKGGFLVVASSPDAIGRFTPPSDAPTLTDGEVPLLKVALRGWAQYLRQQGSEAVVTIAVRRGADAPTVKAHVGNIAEVLDLFSGLDVTLRPEAGRSVLTARLRPAK